MRTAKVLAAQTLKIANMNGLGELARLENKLEDEINYESQTLPREFIARTRRKAEWLVHTKAVLLIVVVLNIIDCILVLGEITVEVHYIADNLSLNENASEAFIEALHEKDPHVIKNWSIYQLYDSLLDATFVVWNEHDAMNKCVSLNSSSDHGAAVAEELTAAPRHRRAAGGHSSIPQYSARWRTKDNDETLKTMLKVSHALHYASISILSVLVAETIVKIIATVPRFFQSKLQIFDAIVIFVSFIVDLVFIEGIVLGENDKFKWSITVLLPWRVIRVLNSLMVAVMEKHHFHLKLMYKLKKNTDKQLQESISKSSRLQRQLELVKELCTSRGIPEWEIKRTLGDTEFTNGNSGGGLMALGKLAFRTLDAFAPVPKSPASKFKNGTAPFSVNSIPLSSSFPAANHLNSYGDKEQSMHMNAESASSRL